MEGARSLQGPVRMLKFLNREIHLMKQFAFMSRGDPETTTDGHSLCTFSKHMAPFFFRKHESVGITSCEAVPSVVFFSVFIIWSKFEVEVPRTDSP